ncbi:MAG: carboxylesterase family protein, partial [Treponemataceae bacterium]|nr:carboxylesterase family protein [Treponemataceae bacterium]
MHNTVELKNKLSIFTGISTEKTNNFLGIKYADAKRFEKAVLKSNYDEKTDATKYGDCCPQMRTFIPENPDSMYYKEFRENLNFTYSEDCLSLNIFAPKNADKLPVLIYVHGGSYTRGSSAERPFDGSNLASKGLIVVTINYRLNIFGSYMGKNLDLYDMKCAIEWVYKNISEFGGNPENITLSGQSAGAMSVQQLILNDEVKKYIKRSIMISGGGLLKGIYAPKPAVFARSFYKSVEKCLKKKGLNALNCSEKDLFETYLKVSKKRPINHVLFAVFPAFDNDIVSRKTLKSAFKKNQLDCLMSVTKDDLSPRSYLLKGIKKYADKVKNKTYLFNFNRDLPGDDNGAFHSSDLWYFFGNLDQHTWRKFDEHDKEISEEIMNRTYAFCLTGNPNCDSL